MYPCVEKSYRRGKKQGVIGMGRGAIITVSQSSIFSAMMSIHSGLEDQIWGFGFVVP